MAVLLASVALGCGPEPGDDTWGGAFSSTAPTVDLVPADSILLEELEIYLGDPFVMEVGLQDPDGTVGEVWVADTYSRSAVGFDGDGRFLNRLGRPGPGPDELTSIFLIWDTGEGEIAAVDQYMRTIKSYDKKTGELTGISPLGAGIVGKSRPIRTHDSEGSFFLPVLDRTMQTSVARLDRHSDRWEALGPYPELHRIGQLSAATTWVTGFWPQAAMAQLDPGDRLVLAFGGEDGLYFMDSRTLDHGLLGTVPLRVRRGFEGKCRLLPGSEIASRGCIPLGEHFSSLRGMWGMGDHLLALVYVDQDFGGDPPAFALTSARIHLTMLDVQRDRACVDLPVAGGDHAKPVFDLQGNSLFVLDRRFTPDGNVATWLTRTPLPDFDACPPAHQVRGWLHRDAG
jgi:hypothetical protein